MQSQLIAGRYQVLRAIGHGGMGTVWLCRDEVLGRDVAVKQIGALPGEPANETKRAMREARSAAALNHPNAVAIYDVVNHDGRPWLVMEYVEGQTLADEISHAGQLAPQRVADIGSQLAGALARAHERGIVHRDIKPGNVLIDKAGRPKISDFGIARGKGDEQLTQIGFLTGTPGYLSPELARGGDPHSASDVWALGATLYSAVEGRAPYEPRSNPIALLQTIATERPRPMTHAGAVGPAIHEMMLEDPARRWDMATSATRLGRIAKVDATPVLPRVELADTAVMPKAEVAGSAVMPRVDTVDTAAMVARPVEPTRRLEAAPPPVDRPGRRGWLPLTLLALLVVALGTAYLLSTIGDPGGSIAASRTTRAATPAKTRATTPPKSTPTTASTISNPPSTFGSSSRNLENFVASYYTNVTQGRERTWHDLTPGMQKAAGGRHGYDGFWKTIDTVKVNQTLASDSTQQAIVNLTFTRKDGTRSTETHQLSFVANGRGYLIEGDRLLG